MRIKRILVVDDESFCLDSMSLILATLGHYAITVNGGIKALKYLKEHHKDIDLILLDLMMPDMYGLDVLRAIRVDLNLKNIPVIIQSGCLNTEDLKTAESNLGIAKISISKPYTKVEVEKAINIVFATH